jgi:hypothetical protein
MTGKVPGGTRSGPVEAASFCEEGPRLGVNPAPVTHRGRASTTRSLERERRNFWPAHRDLPYEPPRPSIRHASRSPRSSAATALRKAPEHGHHLSSLGCRRRCRRSLRYRVRLAAGRVANRQSGGPRPLAHTCFVTPTENRKVGGPTHPWPPPKPLVRSCLNNGFVCPVNRPILTPQKPVQKHREGASVTERYATAKERYERIMAGKRAPKEGQDLP